ncbi:hypothetical protein DFJ77DRAFT_440880 [Powellomyces hirtus]|nr:hypothetical protein DFJ77DRAFT_440880 [Powellomyces hirtus]
MARKKRKNPFAELANSVNVPNIVDSEERRAKRKSREPQEDEAMPDFPEHLKIPQQPESIAWDGNGEGSSMGVLEYINSLRRMLVQRTKQLFKVQEDMTCAVCSRLYIVPYSLKCSHVFCYECIYTWFENLVTKELPKRCPVCRDDCLSRPRADHVLGKLVNHMVESAEDDESLEARAMIKRIRTQLSSGEPAFSQFYPDDEDRLMVDREDGVSRCSRCQWEVVNGICSNGECAVVFGEPDAAFSDYSEDDMPDESDRYSEGSFVVNENSDDNEAIYGTRRHLGNLSTVRYLENPFAGESSESEREIGRRICPPPIPTTDEDSSDEGGSQHRRHVSHPFLSGSDSDEHERMHAFISDEAESSSEDDDESQDNRNSYHGRNDQFNDFRQKHDFLLGGLTQTRNYRDLYSANGSLESDEHSDPMVGSEEDEETATNLDSPPPRRSTRRSRNALTSDDESYPSETERQSATWHEDEDSSPPRRPATRRNRIDMTSDDDSSSSESHEHPAPLFEDGYDSPLPRRPITLRNRSAGTSDDERSPSVTSPWPDDSVDEEKDEVEPWVSPHHRTSSVATSDDDTGRSRSAGTSDDEGRPSVTSPWPDDVVDEEEDEVDSTPPRASSHHRTSSIATSDDDVSSPTASRKRHRTDIDEDGESDDDSDVEATLRKRIRQAKRRPVFSDNE